MWVTKLMISQLKKRIFWPKTTKFGPNLAFLVDMGQADSAPDDGSVGGCGARAVSRKTPIYFMLMKGSLEEKMLKDIKIQDLPFMESPPPETMVPTL